MTSRPSDPVAARHRSRLDASALASTTLSALGSVALVVGRIAGARGFGTGDDDASTFSDVCFFAFLLGLLIAVVAGAATWWTGRRSGWRTSFTTGWLVRLPGDRSRQRWTSQRRLNVKSAGKLNAA